MLSPGRHHERVPRGMRENARVRRELLHAAEDRLVRRRLWEMCRSDVLFYINSFVFQFNPNKHGGEVGPFVTWPFQDDAVRSMLECIEDGEDLVIEKSREMGATWLCGIVFDWLARFHEWKKFLVISRNADAVDKADDTDSVFWKLDHIDRYLPDWMREGRDRKRMLITYGRTNSQIAGTASTGLAGVSGRATAIFVDEYSLIREDAEVRQGTASTSKCRIFNGTHRGIGTEFNKLCEQVDMRKLRMHWTQHPDKVAGLYRSSSPPEIMDKSFQFAPEFEFVMDGTPAGGPFPGIRSPWYDKQAKKIGNSRGVAMDLDINPEGSSSQVFDPLVIRELTTYCEEPHWIGNVLYDRDTGDEPELVPTPGGRVKLWVRPRLQGGVLRLPVGKYAAGADIATGSGHTPSCLTVAEGRGNGTGRKVLEFSNAQISSDEFAVFCVAVCRLFRDENGSTAFFAWENAGPGVRFGLKVVELGYRRIYYKTDDFDIRQKATMKPGWYPSEAAKRELIESYMAALGNRIFENPSRDALAETLRFEYKSGTSGGIGHANEDTDDPAAARKNHGDLVIADALAYKMMKSLWVPELEAGEEPVLHDVRSLAGRRALFEEERRNANSWGW